MYCYYLQQKTILHFLACRQHLRAFPGVTRFRLEPWRSAAFPVIRDLAVDRGARGPHLNLGPGHRHLPGATTAGGVGVRDRQGWPPSGGAAPARRGSGAEAMAAVLAGLALMNFIALYIQNPYQPLFGDGVLAGR